jgi:integrase
MMKSVSAKSVKNALGTLRVAFNWGVRHEVLSRNVATSVKPPMVERFESHWASQDEAKRLLAIFERNDPPNGPMLAIALLTCLRVESEWGAMRWRDVDLKAKTASLVRVRLQDGSIIPAGNSKHKRRLVALSDEAVRFLEIQRKWQARMCDANEGAWVDEEGLVFTTSHGERVRQSTLQRQFLKMQGEAGLPHMRVHDLRHTAATLLLAAGVHVKVVSEMLGHSTVKMTLDTYGHAVPGLTEAAANRLGELLSGRVTSDVTRLTISEPLSSKIS